MCNNDILCAISSFKMFFLCNSVETNTIMEKIGIKIGIIIRIICAPQSYDNSKHTYLLTASGNYNLLLPIIIKNEHTKKKLGLR